MIGPKDLIKAVPKGLVWGQAHVLKRMAQFLGVFLHKFGGVVAFNGEMVFCGSQAKAFEENGEKWDQIGECRFYLPTKCVGNNIIV